jgi:ABC-type dipeptide/oligopeptide/nickel transport system permease subunit
VIRAVSLLVSLPAIIIALVVANRFGQLNLVETTLGILAIICFAVIATGWTEGHDITD